MRLVVAAIGRLKDGPERELAERYRKRAEQTGRRIGFRDMEVVEIRESRAQEVGKRMIEESIALANVIPDKAVALILDERGESLDSATLASRLGRWRDDGRPAAVFIIGGDDGLAPSLRDKASVRLAFGAATWPHQLVRIMLLEQIYRAVSILSGPPLSSAPDGCFCGAARRYLTRAMSSFGAVRPIRLAHWPRMLGLGAAALAALAARTPSPRSMRCASATRSSRRSAPSRRRPPKPRPSSRTRSTPSARTAASSTRP